MMRNKLVCILGCTVLAASLLTGCGSTGSVPTEQVVDNTDNVSESTEKIDEVVNNDTNTVPEEKVEEPIQEPAMQEKFSGDIWQSIKDYMSTSGCYDAYYNVVEYEYDSEDNGDVDNGWDAFCQYLDKYELTDKVAYLTDFQPEDSFVIMTGTPDYTSDEAFTCISGDITFSFGYDDLDYGTGDSFVHSDNNYSITINIFDNGKKIIFAFEPDVY